MKIFSHLYNKTITWSKHRHAPYYLAGVSFIESSIFPIPPDVMLVSMGLAAPKKSWRYALIATLFSVAGGVLGYLIGMYLMMFIQPMIVNTSFETHYQHIMHWFDKGGVWMVILAGVTPFPYKVFTIAAGTMHLAFLPFVLGSLIGRGLRFYLVCGIMYYAGEHLETRLRHYIDIIGWTLLSLIVVVFGLFKWVF